MSVGYDEGGCTDSIEVDLRCADCQEYVHAVGLNSEVVEQWIQERLDSVE